MILTSHSALEFWLKLRHKFPQVERAALAPPQSYNERKLKQFLFRNYELSPSFELITDKRRDSTLSFKYYRDPDFANIPCVRILDGVLVVTPAYLLAWLAERDPDKFYSLLLVACEFCSSFTRANNYNAEDASSGSGLARCRPLLTRASFVEMVNIARSRRSVNVVKKVASMLVENAYSPAEIALALRLSMDKKHGGFGLPKPVLNISIPLKNKNSTVPIREVRPDLFWPKQKFIFEYDGIRFHSAEEDIQQDSVKRNALFKEDYTVLNVTKKQLFNEVDLGELAESLRKVCGRRKDVHKSLTPDMIFARETLRRVIFDYVVKGKIFD